ncbi:hypothetical protein DAPPUDRAFT_252889 [Daphnia pulex]|uniref:CUB domain-containing protein n=1 Tax=Daphnia pulex TaxID=6669 RepID=E9H3Q0_DAPPU|nr:hypothetical protein DAPPUDRAFT_252889 [Daphnia pulex]|eukprot:EFX73549.1 hypothetical protein DAPPUDRAFT_252889 [Daphnia pulex]
MKLIVILVAMMTVCLAVTTKRTTLKSTARITTLKPATSKPKLTTATTRKLNVSTTTKPTTVIPVFSLCRDANSSAATGKIQLNQTAQTNSSSSCVFDIVAPPGRQIQISCSVVSFNHYTSKMTFIGLPESVLPQPVPNRTYSGKHFFAVFGICRIGRSLFSVCRHGQTSSANGTIQPIAVCLDGLATAAAGTITPTGDDIIRPWGRCTFVIEAPPDQKIEFTCTAINLTSFTSQLQAPLDQQIQVSCSALDLNSSSSFLAFVVTLRQLRPMIFVAICAAALPGSPAVQVDSEVQGEQGIAHFRLKDSIFA